MEEDRILRYLYKFSINIISIIYRNIRFIYIYLSYIMISVYIYIKKFSCRLQNSQCAF